MANTCTCEGGCNVWNLGYHPRAAECRLGVKPGYPARTVVNSSPDPEKRLHRALTAHPPFCEDCGVNRADPPSKLCPGCEAYKEHQQ